MEFARAKFEEDVEEGLMLKMSLGDFKAKYGEHRAIAALAVIVEDELVGKKRMIHDASHGVRVNHRIRCRDKIRAPGAREKKQLLREMMEERGGLLGGGRYRQNPPEIQAPGRRTWLPRLPDRCYGRDSGSP